MAILNQPGIIALNAKAVARLSEGQYQDATMLLGRALRRIKERMLDTDPKSEDEDETEEEEMDAEDFVLKSCPVGFDMATDSSISLYNRAFVLSGIDNETIFSTRNEATVSGVLLFNMALCYHLQGIRGLGDHQKLEKALQFYEAAAAIMGLNHNLCGADRLIYLAIYNNKAHIFSVLCCEEDAQRCLSWLKESLEGSEVEGDNLLCNDLVDIHLNVALFHGSRRHAPAA